MSDPSKQLSVRQTAPFPSEKTAENMGNCASKDCTAKLPKTRKVPGPGKESSAMAGKSCNCQSRPILLLLLDEQSENFQWKANFLWLT